MIISNNQLGAAFHMKEAMKFNKLYNAFKLAYHLSPILLLLCYYERSVWILVGSCVFALINWLFSIKTKSLRNINYNTSKGFRVLHDKDMIKLFK